jgi:tetratricopeptide (TPR) repeat protein
MRTVVIAILATLVLAAAPAGAGQADDGKDTSAAVLVDRGRQETAAGAFDAAIRSLTLAREKAPDDAGVYNALADAYIKAGAEPMGVMQLEKSLAIDSTQVDARLRLAEIHSRNRRWNEAGRQYQAVLRRDPENDAAALLLGHLYLMAKQQSSAARALAGYVARHPADEHTTSEYLDALAKSGQDAALADAAESILKSLPDWMPALRYAARARARLGKPAAALDHYKRLEVLQPLGGEDAFVAGRCLLSLDDEAGAAPWFERALADSLDSSTDWSEPAAQFMRRQRWPLAARMFERKTAQDSMSVSAWVNYGLCEQQMKNYETARRALVRAATLRPDYIPGQYALATVYVQMDSTRAARRSFDRLTQLAAGHEEENRDALRQAYRYLSVAQLLDKEWSSALETLEKALRFDPRDVELRLYRAQAFLATNRKAEARREFETVLEMQPANKEAKKGLSLVAQYN